MFQEFLRDTPLLAWPIAAFVLFFTTFVGVLVAILATRRRNFDHVASLPLEDDAATRNPEGGR
jgi:cbb3-type cytochrome oxidase subunit 3